ncbi:MAG: helicase-related protein [bacterium]
MHTALPIDALRPDFDAHRPRHPVVVSAPTGSGKSTQIPRWCATAGPVLVVEPRRVACRSLAVRVAELQGTPLGDGVGYRVRDDSRARPDTPIVFATPGVVLRMLRDDPALDRYATVIIDEFHERSLETDLLLALLAERRTGDRALVVMSATLDADRIAAHLAGAHLHGEGRLYPVTEHHIPGDTLLPDVRGLERRVVEAVRAAADDPGDILVFLPGKAEIAATQSALGALAARHTIIPLHGGLSLDAQTRAFAPALHRKIILATNVAETSLTLPGVGVVIDAGLVRRTRYHGGRGFLTLLPIAADSAAQRAGRAGRTAPGVCYRLWSPAAKLRPHTPPEIHRESLVPLVLAAAACDADLDALPFLDAPPAHAVETARDDLAALGALTDNHRHLTDRGHALFGLPLDPPHGRLLIEARAADDPGALDDAIDLVAVLAVGRPLFRFGPPPSDPRDDLRDAGCDALAAIRAVRIGDIDRHHLAPYTLTEARRIRRRLRRAFALPDAPPADAPIDRRRLALTALRADPRAAHVARKRKRHTAWSNGGTEVELGRDSAVTRTLDDPHATVDALVVLETRAIGTGPRDTAILITCALPAPIPWLVAAGVGRERVARVHIHRGALTTEIERVHAKKTLATREATPTGQLARDALAAAFLDGRLWRDTLAQTRDRLEAAALHARLEADAGRPAADVPSLEDWTHARIAALGFESGDDLALLTPDDLLADDLPAYIREALDKTHPRQLTFSDIEFTVRYDVSRRTVILHKTAGRRRDPPPLTWLPSFRGFRIIMRDERGDHPLRDRR